MNVPASQLAHALAPSSANLPASHATHVVDTEAPAADDADPAAQLVHLACAVNVWYCPATHATHDDCALSATYVPAAHPLHTVADASE